MEEGRALGEFYGLKSVGVSENGLFLIEKPDGEVVEFSNDQLKMMNIVSTWVAVCLKSIWDGQIICLIKTGI